MKAEVFLKFSQKMLVLDSLVERSLSDDRFWDANPTTGDPVLTVTVPCGEIRLALLRDLGVVSCSNQRGNVLSFPGTDDLETMILYLGSARQFLEDRKS